MLPFTALLLRSYYGAIGWNEDNSYSQLTRASSSLLDFQIPQSLILQLANSPTPIFFTSYALDALPQLNGSISYITTSEPLEDIGPSRSIAFRDVVERFRVYPPPRRPPPKDEVWLGGRRVEGRDYLLYSRLHLPSLHLSGLATTRLTPTLQAHLAFLSQPAPPSTTSSPSGSYTHSRVPSETSVPSPTAPSTPGNVLLSLQHDTGRYSGEYTYSAQDGMFGWRGLFNFGWQDPDFAVAAAVLRERESSSGSGSDAAGDIGPEGKRIDEEEMMDGGLRGRFSAGGEVYFSAKQRSFGISTGLRFTTIPPSLPLPPGSPPPSPPTTLTLLYNPLIGFLSTAYSAQISPTVALSSRFGVNVYSYESDLSIGGEWWIGRRRGKRNLPTEPSEPRDPTVASARSRASTSGTGDGADLRGETEEESLRRSKLSLLGEASLRDKEVEDRKVEKQLDSPIPLARPVGSGAQGRAKEGSSASASASTLAVENERDGVLKARLSGNSSIALLYEARIRNCFVSFGVVSDLLSRQRPIRSIGVEVQYFS
ncbi:Mitochondrial distribution and morphology protein 10 [Saitozyma podzolica]|uniref:Mitochondrial distribution and morphology protein 10 n=1 Tax=Saitozyma podzolica TaxID=1890683 RepID=A0A427YI52_9TREE|nr:Mitochondrial distribution and morphology protein 10 [Saitozyma podzolica]